MKRILFQGDSITDTGRNTVGGSPAAIGQGYAVMVAGELMKRFPKEYEFFNRGISGNRIVDLYARIKKDAWNLQPDVMSILIGVNDVWHEFGEQNGVDVKRYENTYRMLIQDTLERFPNIRLMLMEPFTLKGTGNQDYWEDFQKEVALRAAVVKKLAQEFNLTFVELQKAFDEASKDGGAEYWLIDGVHPTLAGHQLIAGEWLKGFLND